MAAKRAATGNAAEFVRLGQPGARPGPRSVVLVPGADVPLIALDLPAGLRSQAREEVARRQLKDKLGLDPGAALMRPFATADTGDAWSRVLVADAGQLATWRALSCRAVLPDYLALPTADGLWTLAVADGDLMARLGPGDGFTASLPLAAAMLRAALAKGPPAAVLRLGGPAEAVDTWLAETGLDVLQNTEDAAKAGLPPPQRLAHGELDMDLRRDPQAARERLRRRISPWRWPYFFAACAAGFWAAAQILEIREIEARTQTVTAASRALTTEHFVPTGPILDIRTQVARALEAARQSVPGPARPSDPLDVFGRAAEVIAAEGVAKTELASFTRGDGLILILRLPDFAAADRMAEALQSADLDVTRGDTRVSGTSSGVRTELRIALDSGAGQR